MTEEQYKNIRSQIWTVLGITVVGFIITFIRIESVKCHCSSIRAEANNSGINITTDTERVKLLREVLESQGKLHAGRDVRKPSSGESQP